MVCDAKLLLKRTPIDAKIRWSGKPADLETFIRNFTGAICQQPQMACILHPKIAKHWLECGDLQLAIDRALRERVDVSCNFITGPQFAVDIVFLYGALKTLLPPNGGERLVDQQDETKDGLVVWVEFLATFRYGGNQSTYIFEQQAIMTQSYDPRSGKIGAYSRPRTSVPMRLD